MSKEANTRKVAGQVHDLLIKYLKEQVISNIGDDLRDGAEGEEVMDLMEEPFDVAKVRESIKNSKEVKAVFDELIEAAVMGITYMTEGAD